MSGNLMIKNLVSYLLIFIYVLSFTGYIEHGLDLEVLSDVAYEINYSYNQDITIASPINNCFIKGKICYGYQTFPNPDYIVKFELDNPGILYTINPSTTLDKISGGTWINDKWWCCEYTPLSNSNIWIIDHITGNMTLVGASGSSEGLNGLAYDDDSDILYACGSKNLFTIDRESGAASLVGSFGINNGVMVGIACDGYGMMYGEDLHTDSLYSINLSTGKASLIGSFNVDLNHGQDIEFDKEEGICYLAAYTVNDGDEGALYTCNLTTAVLTKIGKFGTVTTQITGFAIPYKFNEAPNPPTIIGPKTGKIDTYIEYTFFSDDPEYDNIIQYIIDWGDGNDQQTISGPFSSGEKIMINHIWESEGEYNIKAKAEDTNSAESEWGSLIVTIPRNKIVKNIILHRFLQNHTNLFPILQKLLNKFGQ